MYQRYNERIKAKSQDGTTEIILPVDDLTARPVPYVPEGGTAIKLYDDRWEYRNPTYAIRLELKWAFERTDYRANVYDKLLDLLYAYDNGEFFDFLIKYNRDTDSFTSEQQTGIAPYRLPKMIPDLDEETGGIIFEQTARQKERSITLRTRETEYSLSQVSFLFD